jgi:hypothetical protein
VIRTRSARPGSSPRTSTRSRSPATATSRGDDDIEIDALDVVGNGDVQLATVRTDHLGLYARGAGAVHVDELISDHLTVDLSGDGDVWLAGEADTADVSIQGNGSLHAEDLSIVDLTIDLTGAGNATVHVTGTISGEVGGSGNLEILGDPTSDVTESGAGTIVWL